MINRRLEKVLSENMWKGKTLVLIGARQVGKTTLFKKLSKDSKSKTLWLNCDQKDVRDLLADASLQNLRLLIGDNKVVIIDEAQRIDNIGLTLKLIHENFPDTQLMVTGSSSLELHNRLNESMAGRKMEYYLYPISTAELYDSEGLIRVREMLEQRMIYGSYPNVLYGKFKPQQTLMELVESYLYKDILELDGIRKSQTLSKLVSALALQVGSEVSYNELSRSVGIDNKTVERYIDILEKCHIVFRLSAFNRNIRSELTKSKKVYFYDTGIRNAVISQFASLNLRMDVGALWENFFIAERIKRNHYIGKFEKRYFWRTNTGQEIDYIEEEDGRLTVFEMKWNVRKGRAAKLPQVFAENYDVVEFNVVTPENYLDFLL